MVCCCMMVEVLIVDVVVINLIYFVVVLKYIEGKMGVFKVVVKGVDDVVVKICELVCEYKVLLLEVLLLVCVLYVYIEIGDEIFEVFYIVVVEVLVYVF